MLWRGPSGLWAVDVAVVASSAHFDAPVDHEFAVSVHWRAGPHKNGSGRSDAGWPAPFGWLYSVQWGRFRTAPIITVFIPGQPPTYRRMHDQFKTTLGPVASIRLKEKKIPGVPAVAVGCRIQDPGTHGEWCRKTTDFSHSAQCAPNTRQSVPFGDNHRTSPPSLPQEVHS